VRERGLKARGKPQEQIRPRRSVRASFIHRARPRPISALDEAFDDDRQIGRSASLEQWAGSISRVRPMITSLCWTSGWREGHEGRADGTVRGIRNESAARASNAQLALGFAIRSGCGASTAGRSGSRQRLVVCDDSSDRGKKISSSTAHAALAEA